MLNDRDSHISLQSSRSQSQNRHSGAHELENGAILDFCGQELNGHLSNPVSTNVVPENIPSMQKNALFTQEVQEQSENQQQQQLEQHVAATRGYNDSVIPPLLTESDPTNFRIRLKKNQFISNSIDCKNYSLSVNTTYNTTNNLLPPGGHSMAPSTNLPASATDAATALLNNNYNSTASHHLLNELELMQTHSSANSLSAPGTRFSPISEVAMPVTSASSFVENKMHSQLQLTSQPPQLPNIVFQTDNHVAQAPSEEFQEVVDDSTTSNLKRRRPVQVAGKATQAPRKTRTTPVPMATRGRSTRTSAVAAAAAVSSAVSSSKGTRSYETRAKLNVATNGLPISTIDTAAISVFGNNYVTTEPKKILPESVVKRFGTRSRSVAQKAAIAAAATAAGCTNNSDGCIIERNGSSEATSILSSSRVGIDSGLGSTQSTSPFDSNGTMVSLDSGSKNEASIENETTVENFSNKVPRTASAGSAPSQSRLFRRAGLFSVYVDQEGFIQPWAVDANGLTTKLGASLPSGAVSLAFNNENIKRAAAAVAISTAAKVAASAVSMAQNGAKQLALKPPNLSSAQETTSTLEISTGTLSSEATLATPPKMTALNAASMPQAATGLLGTMAEICAAPVPTNTVVAAANNGSPPSSSSSTKHVNSALPSPLGLPLAQSVAAMAYRQNFSQLTSSGIAAASIESLVRHTLSSMRDTINTIVRDTISESVKETFLKYSREQDGRSRIGHSRDEDDSVTARIQAEQAISWVLQVAREQRKIRKSPLVLEKVTNSLDTTLNFTEKRVTEDMILSAGILFQTPRTCSLFLKMPAALRIRYLCHLLALRNLPF